MKKIPELWYIDKTDNPYKMQVIYDWMQTQKGGDHWELSYATTYYLHNNLDSDPDGHTYLTDFFNSTNYEFLSFAKFEKYIVNKEPIEQIVKKDNTYSKILINIIKEINKAYV
jgi:hypothetical protein